jgi:hypothetical protein
MNSFYLCSNNEEALLNKNISEVLIKLKKAEEKCFPLVLKTF